MSHNGALTFGTLSTITRLPHGVTFAMVFNHLAVDFITMVVELERSSVQLIGAIGTWPSGDRYSEFA